jgi:hypothetical protein
VASNPLSDNQLTAPKSTLKIRVSGVRFPLWPFGVTRSFPIGYPNIGHQLWVAACLDSTWKVPEREVLTEG